ncbi:hypothetical protein Bca4012_092531 [Brassica carinata]
MRGSNALRFEVNERRSLVTRATTVGLVVAVHLEMAKRSYWIHHHSIVCVNVSKAVRDRRQRTAVTDLHHRLRSIRISRDPWEKQGVSPCHRRVMP